MQVSARAIDFIAVHEGFVPHMYRDTRGYLTFGYGFRPPIESYPWVPSIEEAHEDAARIERLNAVGKSHRYYAKFCRATLPEAACRKLLAHKVQRLYDSPTLVSDWRLHKLPEPAQVALLDMAYNLGIAGLGKFLRLRAAVNTDNWEIAAKECHRNGPSAGRNAATAALFLECG